MPLLSTSTIERVREGVDIVELAGRYTRVTKRGNKIMAFCPFHNDVNNPGLKLDPELGLYHCWTCEAGGGVFDFVMEKEDISFPEAVIMLAEQYGIDVEYQDASQDELDREGEKRTLKAINLAAESFMQAELAASSVAMAELESRHFSPETIAEWRLGWAPGHGKATAHLKGLGFKEDDIVKAGIAKRYEDGNVSDFFRERIMFPIHDELGKTVGFGGRIIGKGEPKYLNTGETPVFSKKRTAYGMSRARKAIQSLDSAVVSEGYVDVAMLHQNGVRNTVGVLGTAFTPEHLNLIARRTKNLYVCLDADAAGHKAARRVVEIIEEGMEISVFALVVPEGKDPDDYFNKFGHTGEEFLALLDDAPNIFAFVVSDIVDSHMLSEGGSRERAYNDAVEFLKENASKMSLFQAVDACEVVASRLEMGMTGNELYGKILSGKTARTGISVDRQKTDNSVELNLLRLLIDNPKKRRVFEREVLPEYFQDSHVYEIYSSVISAMMAGGSPASVSFDDKETQKTWAKFSATHPPTDFDDRQADSVIERNLAAMRRAHLKQRIDEMESSPDGDVDTLLGLKVELAKMPK